MQFNFYFCWNHFLGLFMLFYSQLDRFPNFSFESFFSYFNYLLKFVLVMLKKLLPMPLNLNVSQLCFQFKLTRLSPAKVCLRLFFFSPFCSLKSTCENGPESCLVYIELLTIHPSPIDDHLLHARSLK